MSSGEMVGNEVRKETFTAKSYGKVRKFYHAPLLLLLFTSPKCRGQQQKQPPKQTPNSDSTIVREEEGLACFVHHLRKTEGLCMPITETLCQVLSPWKLNRESRGFLLSWGASATPRKNINVSNFLLFLPSSHQSSSNKLNGLLPWV